MYFMLFMEQAGFVLNVNKSRLKPEQVGVWLGWYTWSAFLVA